MQIGHWPRPYATQRHSPRFQCSCSLNLEKKTFKYEVVIHAHTTKIEFRPDSALANGKCRTQSVRILKSQNLN